MRFNGAGIEYEGNWQPVSIGRDCDANFKPYYNARTLSTGAEVSLWVWQEYLHTGDRAFLETNYPVMRESARFLLASERAGAGWTVAHRPDQRARNAMGRDRLDD